MLEKTLTAVVLTVAGFALIGTEPTPPPAKAATQPTVKIPKVAPTPTVAIPNPVKVEPQTEPAVIEVATTNVNAELSRGDCANGRCGILAAPKKAAAAVRANSVERRTERRDGGRRIARVFRPFRGRR